MQEIDQKSDKRRKLDILKFIGRVRRLKNKLFSYGMSIRETIQTILYQFLKAPPIDWSVPHNTTIFYQIQEKYRTDTNTAQLIFILTRIVPNWETRSVVQYLHQTLTYNALSFGIDLEISDDSSNEDGSDMTLMLLKAKKKNKQFHMRTKKRSHLGTSSNVLFYNSTCRENSTGQQLKKKIHTLQSDQQEKQAFNKSPQSSLYQSFRDDSIILLPYQNDRENKDCQSSKFKRSKSQEENPKRTKPCEIEILQEENLEKKIKKSI